MINSNGQSAGEASGSGGVCGKLMHSGPVWMRIYYSTPDNQDCRLLAETVKCQWQPQFFFFLFNNRKMIYFQLGKFRPGRKGLLWLERSQMTICILPCPWYSHAAIETISCKETRCAGILGRLIRRPPVWLQLFFSGLECGCDGWSPGSHHGHVQDGVAPSQLHRDQRPRSLLSYAQSLEQNMAPLVTQTVKACNVRDPGSIPGSERSMEKGMATHSSVLAWRFPWTEEPGWLQSMGSQRVRHY